MSNTNTHIQCTCTCTQEPVIPGKEPCIHVHVYVCVDNDKKTEPKQIGYSTHSRQSLIWASLLVNNH